MALSVTCCVVRYTIPLLAKDLHDLDALVFKSGVDTMTGLFLRNVYIGAEK
jgi:hypothetical protein